MTDQTSQFMAILTAIGEAKQANANVLGIPWVITSMAVGDANGTEPIPQRNQTTLLNERHRAQLTQLMIDEDNDAMIIAELVIPEHVGGWWIREIGLYDEDGDLVVVANCPPTYKPELSQGSGRTQVIRLNIIVSSAQNIELKIDPSVVLATREYVDKILVRANQAEAEAGTDAVKFMTPLRTAQAIAAQGLKLGTTGTTAAAGNDSRIVGAVQSAGTGLTKTGTALAVKYGTTAGTAVEGNDSRLAAVGNWNADVVSQAEAEAGTATTARKWTAQRVAQAIAKLGLKLGTTAGTAAAGNDARITGAVQSAGTGLTKSGTSLNVNYGTTAGTAVQGNDPRLAAAGDWNADVVSQAEAEAGTATTARKWTAQRVAQAIAKLGLKLGTTAGTAAAGNDARITGAVQSAGTGLTKSGTSLNVNYGTTAGTAAAGNDARIRNAMQVSHPFLGMFSGVYDTSRLSRNTVYYNTSGRPIFVIIYSLISYGAEDAFLRLYVNGVETGYSDGELRADYMLCAIVPDRQSYYFEASSNIPNDRIFTRRL